MKAPKAKINHEKGFQKLHDIVNDYIEKYLNHFNLHVDDLHVNISTGNAKIGLMGNVSLPPVVTCPGAATCQNYCYAIRNFNRLGSERNTWAENYILWKCDPDRYFEEISKACFSFRFFRWHVGGDVPNFDYFAGVVKVAKENHHCRFLIFTKSSFIVNAYVKKFGLDSIPENLQILFSADPGAEMINPYEFPECHINFEDENLNTFKGCRGEVFHCGGDCQKCIMGQCGCFFLRHGDVTIINQH